MVLLLPVLTFHHSGENSPDAPYLPFGVTPLFGPGLPGEFREAFGEGFLKQLSLRPQWGQERRIFPEGVLPGGPDSRSPSRF